MAPTNETRAEPRAWNVREWLWVRVLGGALYGIRPGRMGLAFFGLVLIGLLIEAGRWIDAGLRAKDTIVPPLGPMPVVRAYQIPWEWFVETPLRAVEWWPVTTLVFLPLAVFVGLLVACAIARIAAAEISLEKHLSWTDGLSYALRSWRSLLGAALGPVLLIWFIAAMVGLFGMLLLRWPYLNVVGAILFPLVLLGTIVAAALALIYVVASCLLVPAVAADGSDAIDAVQRAYAYVVDRPVRMILLLILALVGLMLTVAVVGLFVFAALYFAAAAASLWAGEDGGRMIVRAVRSAMLYVEVGPVPTPMPDEGSYEVAGAIIRFWSVIVAMLVPAALLSGAAAAATMLYLAMRKAADGQDIEELWWPGKVDRAMAESMAARAKAAGTAGIATGDLQKADYE